MWYRPRPFPWPFPPNNVFLSQMHKISQTYFFELLLSSIFTELCTQHLWTVPDRAVCKESPESTQYQSYLPNMFWKITPTYYLAYFISTHSLNWAESADIGHAHFCQYFWSTKSLKMWSITCFELLIGHLTDAQKKLHIASVDTPDENL